MTISAKDGVQFLKALFAEQDTIVFRPVETYSEDGTKRSRVVYRSITYGSANDAHGILDRLIEVGERERANLFFGACPRVGRGGHFDLAWQIRTVRTLWCDIDNVSVIDSTARVNNAGLPQPSIVVNSGHGVHLYWLLNEPYLIDDADSPLPVQTEWIDAPNGKKKSRKYILADSEKVYLDARPHTSRSSTKALRFQDLLGGIAKAVGGDHTTDLSRLLRLPGTLNRKNQRNGRDPMPCVLVECDDTRRYPLTTFDSFTSPSRESVHAQQVAAMQLPSGRKLSARNGDRLRDLIAVATIAPVGSRSEADFGLCCFAVRNGYGKEDLWAQVAQIGKFAEQGRRYFDVTWGNAEYDTQVKLLEKAEKQVQHNAAGPSPSGGQGRPTITVNSATTPVADTLHDVTNRLRAAGNCFLRSDQLVAVNCQELTSILNAAELAGLLNEHVEFYYVDGEMGEYRPFSTQLGNTWLNQHVERSRLPQIKLFTRNPVFTEDWRLVPPQFDVASGIYYAGPPVEALSGTEHLDTLLKDFCFKSVADRTNYIAMLLTVVLIARFIGSKPAILFNGNQPELGKTMLAQILSILRDGQVAETASYNPNDEEFEKRLGAIVRRGATTIIIDNAKSRGRNVRIESACLERCITDAILSFRLLGQSDSIRAENSHIFCITANSADISRDLVTRSAVVNLHHEGNPKRRQFHLADPEGYALEHRLGLLGELIGMVGRWKALGSPLAHTHSRFNKRGWGNIVGGILQTCGEPDFLGNAEEAAGSLDETRREFTELVAVLADHQQVVWTAAELVEVSKEHRLLTGELGDGSSRGLATKMGNLTSRYHDERFDLDDGRQVTFQRDKGRKGNVYRVFVRAEP